MELTLETKPSCKKMLQTILKKGMWKRKKSDFLQENEFEILKNKATLFEGQKEEHQSPKQILHKIRSGFFDPANNLESSDSDDSLEERIFPNSNKN
jgi:hypothetical protein